MQLVRYSTQQGGARVGLLENGLVHDLEAASGGRASGGDMKALMALGRPAIDRIADAARRTAGVAVADVRLLAPIANPGKLFAVAGGYYTHEGAERLGPDAKPYLFCKMTDDIRGPGDPITIWKMGPDVVDEIEIAIVIGTGGKNIPAAQAMDHVLGYTICNDVSGRRLALPPAGRRDENFDNFIDWINGKWLDGYAILGPSIVTADEVGDLGNLKVMSRISGQVRVDGTTRNINIPFGELVAFASSLFTLRTGDIITTGMPHGLGDEVFLKAGDVVEGIVERLGTLRNPVVAEA
jgi:2-keto-4-pentenoate hydratase/2-oxohepta-3-ene-1,7-dioic acid hydratase in catechol pathway